MTDTTKAAVEAAWQNYCEAAISSGVGGDGETDLYDIEGMNDAAHEISDLARKLVAERDAAMAGAVRVKPLVWGMDGIGRCVASSLLGAYLISKTGWGRASDRNETRSDDPKSAAQTDYEARILSALAPDTDQGGGV